MRAYFLFPLLLLGLGCHGLVGSSCCFPEGSSPPCGATPAPGAPCPPPGVPCPPPSAPPCVPAVKCPPPVVEFKPAPETRITAPRNQVAVAGQSVLAGQPALVPAGVAASPVFQPAAAAAV